MNLGNDEGNNIKSFPLLIVVFVVGGMVEFSFKLYNMYGNIDIKENYLFWTFLFSAMISGIILIRKEPKFGKMDIILGMLTGLPNFFVSFFSLLAVAVLPTYIVYPMICVGTILLVNVVNLCVFKEKPSKCELISTVGILIALVLLNV
jgi:multidrug transporter EmrE-like cation transporter